MSSTTQENQAALPQRPGETPTCSYCVNTHPPSLDFTHALRGEEVRASPLRPPTSAPCSHDSLVVLLLHHRAAAGPRPADEDQNQTQVRTRKPAEETNKLWCLSLCSSLAPQVLLQHVLRGCSEEGGGAAYPPSPPPEEPLQSLVAGPQQALPAGSGRCVRLCVGLCVVGWFYNTSPFTAGRGGKEEMHIERLQLCNH